MKYDQNSFMAGLIAGRQMKGWSAYGVMSGWNPDGDLIVRPITQGVPSIKFGADAAFTISPMVDTVDEDTVFPAQELPEITQEIGAVVFAAEAAFVIAALNERLVLDQVIKSYSIDKDINPLEYDDTIVFINSDDAFTLKSQFEEYSESANIDHGKLQLLDVDTDRFESIEAQEVTLC